MSVPADKEFADYLRDQEILSSAEIQRLAGHRSKTTLTLGQAILDLKLMDEPTFLASWSAMRGLELLRADQLRPEPEALQALPRDVCVRYSLLPLAREPNRLTVASSDPTNTVALDDVRFLTGLELRCVAARSEDIAASVERSYPVAPELPAEPSEDESSPVIREVQRILDEAIREAPSHVHLEPTDDAFVLLFRIEGVLREVRRLPKTLQPGVTARLKILGELDIAERRLPQSGTIRLQQASRDFGIATFPTAFHRERITLWPIDGGAPIPSPQGLGFDADVSPFFTAAARAREGLFIVAGAGSSGRTTTLYSIAGSLAASGRNVITVEDRVLRRMTGFTQATANPQAGYPLSRVFQHALRQDADVLVLDPLKDPECLDMALGAATKGRVVLAGFYSPCALDALDWLRTMAADRFLLGHTLRAVLAQTLFRLLCPSCKQPEKTSGKAVPPFVPRGCPGCRQTGYRGRSPLGQLLEVNDEWRSWIQGGQPLDSAPRAARDLGKDALRKALLQKVSLGVTSPGESLGGA